MKQFTKDPDATLDYTFDWTDWLEPVSDTIVSAQALVNSADLIVTKTDVLGGGTKVVVWLRGGVLDEDYDVTCRITTGGGRIDDRTVSVYIAAQ